MYIALNVPEAPPSLFYPLELMKDSMFADWGERGKKCRLSLFPEMLNARDRSIDFSSDIDQTFDFFHFLLLVVYHHFWVSLGEELKMNAAQICPGNLIYSMQGLSISFSPSSPQQF